MAKGGRLTEDEIKYIVSVESDKAQQEIHELTKETKALAKEERARRQAMIELESQGKKNTDEYKQLKKETKEYSDQIRANNQRIGELTKKMDVNAMSMVQLRKQAKDLQRQLDNTSKALNPKVYAETEAQLSKVNQRMYELKASATNLKDVAKSTSALSTMFGVLYAKALEWVGELMYGIKDFISEGITAAAAADGVVNAFRKLDDGSILNRLRTATKGTVNDLELMKAVVRAKDFRIPLEDLGKYLQFAQLKAQQTGQSVEYMTESIIMGLGRQSVKILDNLGLSALEINEQVTKTGDFLSGVAAIIDKQLVSAGGNYVSAADRMMKKTVDLQNAQREMGEAMLPIAEQWDESFGSMKIGVVNLITWLLKYRDVILTLSTAAVAYLSLQKLQVMWNAKYAASTLWSVAVEKLQAIQLSVSKKAFLAKLIVLDLYKGRCDLATASTEMFNLVLKTSPIVLFGTLLLTASAAFLLFKNKVSIADKSVADFNSRLAVQKVSLNSIFEELKKTNPGTSERSRLVKELNDKYGDLLGNYDLEKAKLGEITKAQNAANTALSNRIATEMKSEAIQSVAEKSVKTRMNATRNIMNAFKETLDPKVYAAIESNIRSFLEDSSKSIEDMEAKYSRLFTKPFSGSNAAIVRLSFASLRKSQKGLSAELNNINKAYEPYLKNITSTPVPKEQVDIVEAKKKEIELAEKVIATTPAELKARNQKVAALKEELAIMEALGTPGKKDNSDPNTIALKNLETANEDKLNAIRLAGREQQQSEYETEQAVLKQEEDYYLKRISMLQKFAETAKKKDKRAAYESQIVTAKTKLLDIEVSKEQQAVKALESLRDAELAKEQQVTKAQQTLLSDRLSSGEITQEQYNAMLLTIDSTSADTRLAIAERFANDVSDLELKNAKLKEQTVTEANKAVVDSEKASADARAKQMKYLNEMVKDFKEQFKLTTVGEDLDTQLKALDAAYRARKEMALKNNLDTEALDRAYLQAKENLTQESEQRILAVREQYGLATEQEKYNAQLDQLKQALQQQLLTQQEYEQAVQNLKRDSYKKQFDYYSGLFSGAVQALQQAEMDNVDAKYDAEIAAAQGNAEEVERLENEKAQKKLDIEKKYADINFAVKASQIIADTAVSIMKALAELGPIAGPVAAALMGITGAAQLASANAERTKIKNMTLSSSSSSSSSGKRVATGRESGGYVDVTREQDGKPFRAKYDPSQRGYVDKPTVIVGEGPAGQSREWVASNAAVSNPSVAPIIDVIDKAQRAGNIRTLDLNAALKARGYVGGGYVATPTVTPTPANNNDNSGAALPPELMRRLAQAVINIDENGVAAPVVLTELEKKQQLRDRSRKIGSKKG